MSTQALTRLDKKPSDTCPRNGQVGRKVSSLTVRSQVRDDTLANVRRHDGFRCCAAGDCPVVYYHGGDGICITVEQLRYPVFQKSKEAARPVCYCFSHSVAEIADQVRATGTSTVPAEIKAQCAKGLDACERNNPQGSCCLGNVQKVVKAAHQMSGEIRSDVGMNAACESCCAPTKLLPLAPAPMGSQGAWWGLGAVLSALFASACCWLPLTLMLLGVSAGGAAGFLDRYRPGFLGVAFGLLAVGFYVTYFRRQKCTSGATCELPRPGLRRFNRVMLWVATVLALALAAFPNYASYLLP